ncbi:MAG: GNAT family N-acetyltransferase [Alphaproteobacteria bacterium]|jgi:GNAT superfamily N-acetyltransferase|nr:GNAT family N-acetyltransferase [Alphaproteobacteria bacterium]
MTAAPRLRPAVPADVPEILRLIRELAVFEKEPDAVKATEADLLRDGFGDRPVFEVIVADAGDRLAGFALFFPDYSTWEGRPGLYLEDLYVEEAARGTGLGRRLIAAVARVATARGYTRLNLSVLDWNPARGFYEAIGLVHKTEWLGYRADGPALEALAALAD